MTTPISSGSTDTQPPSTPTGLAARGSPDVTTLGSRQAAATSWSAHFVGRVWRPTGATCCRGLGRGALTRGAGFGLIRRPLTDGLFWRLGLDGRPSLPPKRSEL